MRTTPRSTALIATGALVLGGLTAACEDEGGGIEDDVEQDLEEDFEGLDDDLDDGLDDAEDEVDGDPDDGGNED